MTCDRIAPRACVVRNTAAVKGRTRSVTPGETPTRYLHYGRIILGAGEPLAFGTGALETAFICLGGRASAAVDDATYALGRYDALYVPRDAAIAITPGDDGCDLAEIA